MSHSSDIRLSKGICHHYGHSPPGMNTSYYIKYHRVVCAHDGIQMHHSINLYYSVGVAQRPELAYPAEYIYICATTTRQRSLCIPIHILGATHSSTPFDMHSM